MDTERFLAELQRQPWYRCQIVHDQVIPPRDARHAKPLHALHPALHRRLETLGLWPLYVHQAQAIDAALDGANIIVATPAASGKSLCYHIPVLQSILEDRGARALYLYPTKALAQNQLLKLKALTALVDERGSATEGEKTTNGFKGRSPNMSRSQFAQADFVAASPPIRSGGFEPHGSPPLPTSPQAGRSIRSRGSGGVDVRYAIYDGDTPTGERGDARRSAHILLTNPDMLHLGILPNRQTWKDFFARLKYVVLDESHVYRGVFGSHVALVIRRLRRLCALYGSKPTFVLCSATIANAGEHAEALTGLPFQVIDYDGAPFSGKDFVLWNPPLVNDAKTARRSPNTDATFLFAELLRQHIRTITFCRTRKVAELVYMYVRDRLLQEAPELVPLVAPYRGGYRAEQRRETERGLFEGTLLGVSTTNTLELGIDIGDLDATIMTGYPGTIASTWQQAGRSGRRSERSLSVLIAADNPLDQYLMRHPEAFFGRSQENALISTANPYILTPHLLCAAFELPLTSLDERIFGEEMWPRVTALENEGALHESRGRWFPSTATSYPAAAVNIRSTSGCLYQIVEEGSGVLLETIDAARVYSQTHRGAVYLHHGDAYVITKFDMDARIAWARPHAEPYYTVARDYTDIRIVKLSSQQVINGVRVALGQVDVSNKVVGFKRKRSFTEEILDDFPLDMPVQSFVTVALWWDVPEDAITEIRRLGFDLEGGLHACEHAAIGMLPFFAMCDRADIGGVSTALHVDTHQPQIFIYDAHPGGIGIAEKGYELASELWEATLKTILECPCQTGCPSCIQSAKCGNNNSPLDKAAAAVILHSLLNAEGRPALPRPVPRKP